MSEFQLRSLEGVDYIVGRAFSDEDGEHEAGESYSAEQANKLHYLESFVNAGYLYRLHEEGYHWLPPHVFNAVKAREEAQALIDGDASATAISHEHVETPEMEQARREAEIQTQVPDLINDHAQEAHEQAGYTDAEKMLRDEDSAAKTARQGRRKAAKKA